jgi:cell division protein FtsZ
MNRRSFLKRLGSSAAILGCSLPVAPPTLAMATNSRPSPTTEKTTTYRIIGIGGAGGNIVETIQRRAASERFAPMPEFAYVDLGTPALSRFDTNRTFICGNSSVPLLSLDPLGAGGNVTFARAAALKNRKALQALLTDTDVVCLVTGLGGGTGSGVAPIMARLAREAGVLPVAGVVMPFGFEERDQKAKVALDHLLGQTELVTIFSNDECLQARNEEISFEEVFRSIDLQAMEMVQRLTYPVDGIQG